MKRFAPTCVDLFCGAGGLSLGFQQAGVTVIHAIDNDRAAVKTYRHNLGGDVVLGGITEDTELPTASIVIGGSPCQGFSSSGRRRDSDDRNSLVVVFAQLIVRHRPLGFVFENVEGFLTAEAGKRVIDLLAPLIETGYCIHLRKINAANYGVPQHRKRVFAIGGLGWPPSFPPLTHNAYGAPGALRIHPHLPLTPTLEEALAGLPEPSITPPGTPQDHYCRPLNGIDLMRAQMLKPGQTMRDLPKDLWHESYRARAYRRVMDGTPTEKRGGPPAGIRRLRPDEPSKAITGGACRDFIHPHENRNLTMRECARIQTFPDKIAFYGTASKRLQLIGNAVPPQLAKVIALQLLQDLQNAAPGCTPGALLSFEPTVSTGMSPALQRTTELVERSFMPPQIQERLRL